MVNRPGHTLTRSSVATEILYKPKGAADFSPVPAVVNYNEIQPVNVGRSDNVPVVYPVEVVLCKEDVPAVSREDDFQCSDITGVVKTFRVKKILANAFDLWRVGA